MKRIVVVGGGYGGVSLVRKLHALHVDASVTLIDRQAAHTVLTEIHLVAAGHAPAHHVQVPFADLPGVHFLQAEVSGMDAANRRLFTAGGPVDYDLLVLATGGTDNDFGVPGVREHAFHLHSLTDALQVRTRLATLPEGAPILIAGGGLTGVELAAEVGVRLGGAGNITLVEGGPTLLPGLHRRVQRAARRRLGALGVNVLTGMRIASVEEAMAHFADGSALPFALLVWACGVKASPLPGALGLPVDRFARAVVDANLQTQFEGVYAIGDCAAAAAPTAQMAAQQGAALGLHLAALLEGRVAKVRPPRELGTLLSLGQRYGAGMLGPVPVTGLLPYLMKRATVARWLATAEGPSTAVRYFVGLPWGSPNGARLTGAS